MTRYGTIWASLPMPAVVIDAADFVLELNPAAEEFFNTSAKSICGAPIWDRLAVDAPIEQALARARTTGTPLFVNDVDVGTGERAPAQCNLQMAPLVSVENDAGEGQMLVLISPRELAGRYNQSHTVKSAAKSAIGMAEMLAHEIKNPLAGISGAAQLLSMNLPASDLELTDLIVEETRRIAGLLDQVEQFGNLSAPRCAPVNLHDVLDRARRSALLGFGGHMQIVQNYDPSLPLADADADQLLQVVLNLLKNASEASAEGGTIWLRSYYEHGFRLSRTGGATRALPLQIEVIDDGPGLPPDLADDVFDPFVSGRENGTGLGLALVSKIIAEHGGWISVQSAPGRTVFRISLPMARTSSDKD